MELPMETAAATLPEEVENHPTADGRPGKFREEESDKPLRQRRPLLHSTGENEVYVARHQSLAVLFKMVRKLFDRGNHSEVLIHGMGASITKALHVTQDLLLHYGERLSMEARHGTVEVVDDLVTAYDTEAQERRVSSLTIHLRMRAEAREAQELLKDSVKPGEKIRPHTVDGRNPFHTM
ncbi:unnamed protein product [Effrenium voratum]|nr:unnamed protein product [Effrenium voratum]